MRAGAKSCTLLVLVTDGPISIGNVVLLEEIKPHLSRAEIEHPIAISAACTPLSCKQRNATCKCCAGFVAKVLLVRTGVKVKSVCQIGANHRITGSLIHVL